MCCKNEKDIEEINPKYIEGLKINFVKTVDDVLKIPTSEDGIIHTHAIDDDEYAIGCESAQ